MIGADGAAGDSGASRVGIGAGQRHEALAGTHRARTADDAADRDEVGPVKGKDTVVGDAAGTERARGGAIADAERAAREGRDAGIGVGAGQTEHPCAELGDGARARDHARERGVVGAIEDQAGVIDDVARQGSRRATGSDLQRAGAEGRATRVGVRTCEDLGTGPELDDESCGAGTGVGDDSQESRRPGGAVGAGGVIIDAEGQRTETAGKADGDVARAGERIDSHRAFDDGQAGAAGDVQVGEVIGPDFVAVAAAGEDAALDVDERARAQGEDGGRCAPERAAIPALGQRAVTPEGGGREVTVAGGDIEGQGAGGEDRMERGRIVSLQRQATRADERLTGVSDILRQGGRACPVFVDGAGAGQRRAERRTRRVIDDEQAVVDDRAHGAETARDFQRSRNRPREDVQPRAGLGRGSQPQRAAEGTKVRQRRLAGHVQAADAIATASVGRGQIHRVNHPRERGHVLAELVRLQISRPLGVRTSHIDERLDVRTRLDEPYEHRLDVGTVIELELETTDVGNGVEGDLVSRGIKGARDRGPVQLAAGDPPQHFRDRGVRSDGLGRGRKLRCEERAVSPSDLQGPRT